MANIQFNNHGGFTILQNVRMMDKNTDKVYDLLQLKHPHKKQGIYYAFPNSSLVYSSETIFKDFSLVTKS